MFDKPKICNRSYLATETVRTKKYKQISGLPRQARENPVEIFLADPTPSAILKSAGLRGLVPSLEVLGRTILSGLSPGNSMNFTGGKFCLRKSVSKIWDKKSGFTPLEKATDFNRRSLPLKADGGFLPVGRQKCHRKQQTARPVRKEFSNGVKERSSLTGFTIIESLIVLAIIAVILGMSIPQLSRFAHHSSINSAASQISGILRTARSFAISRNSNYVVNFDNTITAIPNVVWITDPANNIIGKRYTLPKTIRISDITFLNDRVTFKPTGGISGNNGSVTITDTAGVTKQITVINTTGRVKIN